MTGAVVAALATSFPSACLIVALEDEEQPGLAIAAVRPGEGGPSVRREDPITLVTAQETVAGSSSRFARLRVVRQP